MMKVGQIWSAPEKVTILGVPVERPVGIRVDSIDPIRQVAHLSLVKRPDYEAIVWLAHSDWPAELATWTLIEDVR